MNRDSLSQHLDQLLQGCIREISHDLIEKIVSDRVAPLLARIEQLEKEQHKLRPNGHERLREPAPVRAQAASVSLPSRVERTPGAMDPYQVEAGAALDSRIHLVVMKQGACSTGYPAYSASLHEARKVLTELKADYGISLTWGRTSIAGRTWFVRVANGTDSRTEVLAPTLPLAICRLALVQISRNESKLTHSASRASAPSSQLHFPAPRRVIENFESQPQYLG